MHHAGIAGMEDRWASGVDRLPRLGLPVLLMQYFISLMALDILRVLHIYV